MWERGDAGNTTKRASNLCVWDKWSAGASDRPKHKPKQKAAIATRGCRPLAHACPPPSPPPPPPLPSLSCHIAATRCVTTRAASHMTLAGIFSAGAGAIVRDGTDASTLLGRLLEELHGLFATEVLEKWLDPTDLAMLARACWKCGEAVLSSGVEIAGETLEGPLELKNFLGTVELLAGGKDNGCQWNRPTCAPPRGQGTWRCCSGRGSKAASGRVHM